MSATAPEAEVLLKTEGVVKHFPIRTGAFRTKGEIHAVDGVDLELHQGEALGLVGESGCGKSTLASMLMLLEKPTAGRILYRGKDVFTFTKEEVFQYRRDVQMVFQDTVGSLNPRMTLAELIEEPWRVHPDVVPKKERPDRVRELLGHVGLDHDQINRYPHQFSGGQRQRIGIARALALEPKILICDEPVSALDVSVQAQVLNLLKDLRDHFGLSFIFIAHDLSVVRQVSDRVAVMYLGQVVEIGDEQEVLIHPSHPYTQALLSALPDPEAESVDHHRSGRIILSGDLPSPSDPPSGCRFRTRCWKAQPKCASDPPELIERGTGHPARCHFVEVPETI